MRRPCRSTDLLVLFGVRQSVRPVGLLEDLDQTLFGRRCQRMRAALLFGPQKGSPHGAHLGRQVLELCRHNNKRTIKINGRTAVLVPTQHVSNDLLYCPWPNPKGWRTFWPQLPEVTTVASVTCTALGQDPK